MKGRILVVDDQRANVEMLAGVLRARGYEVLTATDGESALEQVRRQPPDIVVSDILMPQMDGYELCRRLRSEPATTLLPVILVTSLDPLQERVNGIDAGADDFHAAVQVQHMFATSFALSEKFTNEFKAFWSLPADWQLVESELNVPTYGSKHRMDLSLLPDVTTVVQVEE